MLVPESTLLVLPRPNQESRFDLDLAALVRRILGDRPIALLGHGESLELESMQITAFPFTGEAPAAVQHNWNSYLVETPDGSVVFCADSAVHAPQIRFLQEALRRSQAPMLLMARIGGGSSRGYRDEPKQLYNQPRGWAWYTPVWSLFAPVPSVGIDANSLAQLGRSGLKGFFPYALGATPWLRVPSGPLAVGICSLDMTELRYDQDICSQAGVPMPPLRYGKPFRLRDL
jgi:hypothetical protein